MSNNSKNNGWVWIVSIVSAAIVVVALYFYSQQLQDCSAKKGVLVKGTFTNVCVEEGEH